MDLFRLSEKDRSPDTLRGSPARSPQHIGFCPASGWRDIKPMPEKDCRSFKFDCLIGRVISAYMLQELADLLSAQLRSWSEKNETSSKNVANPPTSPHHTTSAARSGELITLIAKSQGK